MKYILLHGLGQAPSSWNDTINAMDNFPEIEIPNLANWLQNKKASYRTLYDALEKYCEQFEDSICLCGLSLGGVLALNYAIEHPSKIKALVLIGTQYSMPKRLLKLQNIFFHFMPKSTFLKIGFQKSDFINLCHSMIELNFTENLNKVQCPTLLLCGQKDKANMQASLDLEKLLPNAKLIILENAAHEVNKDAPIELAHELNHFFKTNPSSN